MLSALKKSVLLPSSTKNDVQHSGGYLNVTGFQWKIKDTDVLNIRQINYKAEVQQVFTLGGTTPTIAADTIYTIRLGDPFKRYQAWAQGLIPISTKSPILLSGNAANDREAIYVALVAKINALDFLFVTAASLGGGAGMTITDDAGYFPLPTAGGVTPRRGATTVEVAENFDGSGFLPSALVQTTAAVYSFGEGTYMATMQPVFYAYFGNNLIGGSLDCPISITGTYPLAGQKYNAFLISYLYRRPVPTVSDVEGYEQREMAIFVDNGTGTVTTNLAGYKAFEREMHREIFRLYQNDPQSLIEFFDKPIVFQDPLGAAPTGTANTLGWQLSPYAAMNRTNIGTQTIVAPVLTALGLALDQDSGAGAATDGAHTSANEQTLGVQEFVVGKTEFSLACRVVMADWTDSAFMCGFRKKAVYTAKIIDYTDYACIGTGSSAAGTIWINGDFIVTQGTLNNAATVQTVSAVAPVDAVSILFEIRVALDGSVTTWADGVSYPIFSAVSTPMVFDAGDSVIAFYQTVNINDGVPGVAISEFVAIPSKDWKS